MHGLLTGSIVLVALHLGDGSLAAQPPAAPDTARLRQSLAATLGPAFDIVRTELRADASERAGTFWLVHTRPRRSGDYQFRYTYEYRDRHRPGDPLYTHVEHTSVLRVGEAGCWRRYEGKDACLGDVLILPVVAGDPAGGYAGHTFEVVRRGDAGAAAEPRAAATAAPGADMIANPATAHVRYLGSRVEVMPHRSLGFTGVVQAEFEAHAPGAFNLSVHPSRADTASPPAAARSVPIVVVARGEPVTVLLANERVRSYHDSGSFASHRGNQYLTTVLLLQPGDRISLQYHTTSIRGRDLTPAEEEALHAMSPELSTHPFVVPAGARFNGWIAAHLPAEPR
jgi:hypothetical protein